MKRRIIVDIRFNIDLRKYGELSKIKGYDMEAAFKKAQTKEWIEKRMKIFERCALQSLKHQTSQNFLCVLRYEASSKETLEEVLKNYPDLPSNIIFSSNADKFIAKEMQNYDVLYQVGMDTDHIYAPNFIETIEKIPYEEGVKCLLCKAGYLYDFENNRLAKIWHPSPSCYVYTYNQKAFEAEFNTRTYNNHYYAQYLPHKEITGRAYMLTVHGQNVYHTFDIVCRKFNGILIEDEHEKNAILKEWLYL